MKRVNEMRSIGEKHIKNSKYNEYLSHFMK